jgi:SPP1 gp7 family putative phage head morphogenesis protein
MLNFPLRSTQLHIHTAFDAKRTPSAVESARQHWARIKRSEQFYSRSLRSIAKQVGQFITELYESGREDAIEYTLKNYADILEPWAQAVSERMLADIAQKDEQAWLRHSKRMAVAMQKELRTAPMGKIVTELRDRQVELITSIPLEAAQRAQNLAFEAATQTSARAKEVAKLIQATEKVTENRAILIARTEIARSHAIIQEGRATWIGSESYIWRTLRDPQVRSDHKELEGQVFYWDQPPIADKRAGVRANPGCIYNCRCFAEPVLPAKYQPHTNLEAA